MSHTKVHDTLTKPVLPTKGAVEMITEVLAETVRGADVNAEIDRLLGLWQDASLDAPPSAHATSERPQSEVSRPTTVEKKEEHRQSRQWANPWQQERREREQAEAGDTDTMVNFGILLAKEGRIKEAEHWLRQAAEKGDARAMILLGDLLAETGRPEEAKHWLRQATEEGDARAMVNLRSLLEEAGRVEQPNHWWQRERGWELGGAE
ncbi:tetratricopeptide repeat protein [Nocardiopsis dassonvillei]|uniref:tetratricopeptide repeat protein n=1 Tax=Nocardiopsis dassonvillei TaxID=2014 RepID=UPI003F56504E